MAEQTHFYCIADLLLELNLPYEARLSEILSNFEPFRISERSSSKTSCVISIIEEDLDFNFEEGKLLSDISIVWGDRFTFYETSNYYWTLIESELIPDTHWKMRSTKDFKENVIYCGNINEMKNNFISWYCMVAFAQSSLLHNCVLIHSSVVMNDEFGYGFLGKSGTGKSTHSRLWLKYNMGFKLLNDDNPAVRIMDSGEVFVFGTPWSGKTPCYVNDVRPLKGLVRLKQAPQNIFDIRKNKDALLAILPSCSAIRWNLNLYSTLINILVDIINKVPIAELQCLPDEGAAYLCYSELRKL